jgi:hypothetical protein
MTWLKLRDWAYREDRRLSDTGFWDGIDWPPKHLVGAWLKKRDAAVTQSVEHFLETGEWGELARDDRAGPLLPDLLGNAVARAIDAPL